MQLGPEWKRIANVMGLKNQQEALIEFVKLKNADLFLSQINLQPNTTEKQDKQTHNFNPVDMFYLQCKLLRSFADEKAEWLKPKKRHAKLETKMAQQTLVCEFLTA